eukprot:17143-Heterococcus_DN1.PRE.2
MSTVTTLPGDCCCTKTELTHLQAEQVPQCITSCTCTQVMQLFGKAVLLLDTVVRLAALVM